MNWVLFAGALLGCSSIGIGAYAEHGLKTSLSLDMFYSVLKGIRYQQLHAVVITAIGLALDASLSKNLVNALSLVALGFIVGIALFSFSIYASALTGNSDWVGLTPIGGITLLCMWGALALVSFFSRKPSV